MNASSATTEQTAERIRLRVNDEVHDLVVAVNKTLLEVLREDLGLTGTKHGCELGECGTCTVLVDGEPLLSCLLLPIEVQERHVETVESLAQHGHPHELQIAFAELGASQCGYCTPGIMMSAAALLEEIPEPSVEEIKLHLAGNLCRCTGYLQIIEAIQTAARRRAAPCDEELGERGESSVGPRDARVERTPAPLHDAATADEVATE